MEQFKEQLLDAKQQELDYIKEEMELDGLSQKDITSKLKKVAKEWDIYIKNTLKKATKN